MAGMTQEEFDAFIAENKEHNNKVADVVHRVWVAMKAAGDPIVAVFDSEETTKCETEQDLDRLVFNLDECFLIAESGGWVRIVMENGYDCLVDYTLGLEDALTPVNEYIDKKIDEED
jgi:hypothetical protein